MANTGAVFGYGGASVLYEKKGSKVGPVVPPTSAPANPPPPAKPPLDGAAEALAQKKLTAKEKSLFGEDGEDGEGGAGGEARGGRSKLDSLFGDVDDAQLAAGTVCLCSYSQ